MSSFSLLFNVTYFCKPFPNLFLFKSNIFPNLYKTQSLIISPRSANLYITSFSFCSSRPPLPSGYKFPDKQSSRISQGGASFARSVLIVDLCVAQR